MNSLDAIGYLAWLVAALWTLTGCAIWLRWGWPRLALFRSGLLPLECRCAGADMKRLFARLRAWYLRRFRGFVQAPRDLAGGRGTSWQQHPFRPIPCWFECRCGCMLPFIACDLFIRERRHSEDCTGFGTGACDCPITDARYVKICPNCGLGHWMVAPPEPVRPAR